MNKLASFLIKNTNFVSEIDRQMVNKNWLPFYNAIKGFQQMKFDSVTLDMLIDKELNGIDYKKVIDDAMILPDDYDELQLEFRNILKEFEYDNWKGTTINKLNLAARHIRRNDINKGIKLIHTIKGYSNVSLKSVKDTLLDSLQYDITFNSGCKQLDDALNGFSFGNITSLIGASGAQKTRFSIWLTLKILKENSNFTALYFEKEMRPENISRMIASNLLGEDVRQILQNTKNDSKTINGIRRKVTNKLKNNNIFDRFTVVPNDAFHSAIDIVRIVEEYKPNIFVLDYITMLNNIGEQYSKDHYSFMSEQAEIIKDLVNRTNTWSLVLNQLKLNTVSARNNKIPMTSDIEFGTKIEQFSSDILSIFYPFKYYPTLSLDSIDLKKEWFYLVGSKFRYSSPKDVVLKSNPAIVEYECLDEENNTIALNWLNKYRERFR